MGAVKPGVSVRVERDERDERDKEEWDDLTEEIEDRAEGERGLSSGEEYTASGWGKSPPSVVMVMVVVVVVTVSVVL
jgi:hypothetical protein